MNINYHPRSTEKVYVHFEIGADKRQPSPAQPSTHGCDAAKHVGCFQ
jgi:hypothetical protein